MPTPTPNPAAPTPRPTVKQPVCDVTVTISETVQLQSYEPFRVEISRTVKDVAVAQADALTTALGETITEQVRGVISDRRNNVPF